MGWKSTVDISRKEAMRLIHGRIDELSDRDLADVLETMGFGDDTNLPYYGHNFFVIDKEDPCDGCHQSGSEYCAQTYDINKE